MLALTTGGSEEPAREEADNTGTAGNREVCLCVHHHFNLVFCWCLLGPSKGRRQLTQLTAATCVLVF